ncbi:MFS transporter [Amycolatopsis sp. NPDC004747]
MKISPSTGPLAPPAARRVSPATAIGGWTLLVLSYLINAMDRQVFYPLLPEISAEHGFGLSQGGLLATGFTLGIAVAGLPAGYLVDKASRKTVLVVSVALYSAGTLVTPLSSGFADLAVYRLLSGAGEGMQATALYAVVGSFFALRRSFAFGALGAVFGAGVFLGPLAGTSMAQHFGGWHTPFFFYGTAGLVLAVLIGLLVRRGVTDLDAAGPRGVELPAEHVPASTFNRNTAMLGLACVSAGLVFYGFLGLYPTYLRTQLHYTAAEAAVAASVIGAGAATSILTGWLADRYNPRTILLSTYLGVAVSAWLVFNGSPGHAWQYTMSFILATFIAGSAFTTLNSTMQRAVRPRHVGRAAGMFVSTYYVAAAFSGLLFASLVGALGWRGAALWQLTVLPLATLIPLWFLDARKLIKPRRARALRGGNQPNG